MIAVVLGVLTALFVLPAPVIMPLFAPGFDEELTDLTVNLAQLMFPIVLMLGLTGLVVGVLNSFDHFGPGDRPALLEPRDHRHAGRSRRSSRETTASTPTRSAC